jgi:MoaA/NifB/PqqE/SkfB family radical SAM enzyme
MKYLDKIERLHIEWTSYCNARCPQCARTDNASLPLEMISIDSFKEWFTPELIKNVQYMYSCGNYGDPIAHPHCADFVDWFVDNGCPNVSLHTNGGARDTDFWKQLGERKIRVVFGIDGLEDTNHIYRVGVNWNKLISNVKTFINAGGQAEWAFLIFQHNEHQVEQAKKLATELKFKKFTTKVSSRFVLSGLEKKIEFKSPPAGVTMMIDRSIVNRKNQTITESRKAVMHDENVNQAIKKYGSFENYIKMTTITCKTQKEKSLYIDFQGKVWPCCWMGHVHGNEKSSTLNLYKLYGEDFNDLHTYTLEKIMSHSWFEENLVKSWTTSDRLSVCGITCGTEFETKNNQRIEEQWLTKN